MLASPSTTVLQIRAADAEHPTVQLEDALAIHDREPATCPRASAGSGARLILERRRALAALAVLPGQEPRTGAEALMEFAERHRPRRVDATLSEWTRRPGGGE